VYEYTRPPHGPWGKIAYQPTNIREKATVRNVRFTPENPTPGTRVRIAIEIAPDAPLGRDYFFAVEIGERAPDARYGNYIAVRQTL
jgi:hypothetical protein